MKKRKKCDVKSVMQEKLSKMGKIPALVSLFMMKRIVELSFRAYQLFKSIKVRVNQRIIL